MKYKFRNRYTNAVIHVEDVPDDSPNPTRASLERFAMRGMPSDDLRALRDRTVDDIDDEHPDDLERTLLKHRIEAIDSELASPSVRASLDRASLDGASLDGASLDGASLVGASLDRASLDGARLVCASLVGASLVGARLDGARLVGASLDPIRTDVRAVLDQAPNEVIGLLAKLRNGQINGSCYQGDCACLVGTIANVRGCSYEQLGDLLPNASRPAERWFLALRPGHTPDNHQVAEITERWIVEWMTYHGVAVPARPRHLDPAELADLRELLGNGITERGAEILAKLGWASPSDATGPVAG